MHDSRQPLTQVRSRLVPLRVADLDTDQIISSRHLTSRTTEEFARALFFHRRSTDPDFLLDRPEMAGRNILLAGRNFGCGSSREQAVWALRAGGFQAVVAPSFSDIFTDNAVRNGLLLARLDKAICDELAALALGDVHREVVVDLDERRVTVPGTGFRADFPFPDFHRDLLMQGLGELDYLMLALPEITEYERRREARETG